MSNNTPASPIRKVIRWKVVREATGLSRTAINDLEAANDFPQRIQLGPRAVGWFEEEVATWIDTRRRKAH
jgi:prophage regulatory protein